MHTFFIALLGATKLIVICMVVLWALTIVSLLGFIAFLNRANKASS